MKPLTESQITQIKEKLKGVTARPLPQALITTVGLAKGFGRNAKPFESLLLRIAEVSHEKAKQDAVTALANIGSEEARVFLKNKIYSDPSAFKAFTNKDLLEKKDLDLILPLLKTENLSKKIKSPLFKFLFRAPEDLRPVIATPLAEYIEKCSKDCDMDDVSFLNETVLPGATFLIGQATLDGVCNLRFVIAAA